MTATNHTLTGVLIAVAVRQPLLAIPLSFLSHFALDSLPHFADDTNWTNRYGRKFKLVLSLDFLFAMTVLGIVLVTQPANWLLIGLCGILGASPDLMWLPRYINELRHRRNPPKGWIARFHSSIQKNREHAWGIFIELAWASGAFWLLLHHLPV